MTKLSEVITELEACLDHHRIWTEARNYLRRYSDDEISNREKIKKDDGTEVGTDSVAEVIQEITEEKLRPIEKRIEEIRNLEIGNVKKKDPKKDNGKAGGKKEGNGQGGGEDTGGSKEGGESRSASQGNRRLRGKKNPSRGPSRKQGPSTTG